MRTSAGASLRIRSRSHHRLASCLPQNLCTLVRIVTEGDEDKAVKAEAKASLASQVSDLLHAMCGSDKSVRIQAAQMLVSAWRGDAVAAEAILSYADLRDACRPKRQASPSISACTQAALSSPVAGQARRRWRAAMASRNG